MGISEPERYVKIDRNKWLKLRPTIYTSEYYEGELDDHDRLLDMPPYRIHDIVISHACPGVMVYPLTKNTTD